MEFFQTEAELVQLYGCTIWTQEKPPEKKLDAECYFKQILKASFNKASVVRPLTSHLRNHPCNTSSACWTLLLK